MAEQATEQPQAGGSGQPQAGENTQATAQSAAIAQAATDTDTETGQGATETISLDEARKLRSEAANLRKRLKQFETDAQTQAEAKLGDLEKATKQLGSLTEQVTKQQAALRAERTGRQVDRLAAKMGLDPDLAARLLATESVEYDEDENPIGLDKALKALTVKWPHLVKPATPPPGGSTNAGDGRGSGKIDPQVQAAELKQRYRIS